MAFYLKTTQGKPVTDKEWQFLLREMIDIINTEIQPQLKPSYYLSAAVRTSASRESLSVINREYISGETKAHDVSMSNAHPQTTSFLEIKLDVNTPGQYGSRVFISIDGVNPHKIKVACPTNKSLENALERQIIARVRKAKEKYVYSYWADESMKTTRLPVSGKAPWPIEMTQATRIKRAFGITPA